MRHTSWLLVFLTALVTGCGDDVEPIADAGGDAGPPMLCTPLGDPDPGTCARFDGDYRPGFDDAWPPCISDDGAYHRIEPTISSIARVDAFERIATLIFDPNADARPDDFVAARMLYQADQGLDSRVVRRYDPHFAVPEGTDCTTPGVPATYPDYCVGPAVLQPLLLDALAGGIAGTDLRRNAARIEAGLLWFLYVSTYKEALTCTSAARDCDSSYAYYTGGEEARCGIGLSRYVNAVHPWAHDRAWDGLLALRCWRDLDSAEVATDLARRDLAREQIDRALLHGLSALLRDRIERLAATRFEEQTYHHAFVATFAPALDRAMRDADAAAADALAAEAARTDPATVDTAAAIAAIDAVFDCP